MDQTDIAKLEHAGRAAMAWVPETDQAARYSLLLTAALPAAGIIAVAALVLLAVI